MIGRRAVLGALAGAGVAGRQAVETIAHIVGESPPPLLSATKIRTATERGGAPTPNRPLPPKMAMDVARRIALSSESLMREARSEYYERVRGQLMQPDPDLAVLKSFSPMAKLVFTRQRHAERAFESEVLERRPEYDVFERFIRKLMWGGEGG